MPQNKASASVEADLAQVLLFIFFFFWTVLKETSEKLRVFPTLSSSI